MEGYFDYAITLYNNLKDKVVLYTSLKKCRTRVTFCKSVNLFLNSLKFYLPLLNSKLNIKKVFKNTFVFYILIKNIFLSVCSNYLRVHYLK